ncbi:MAG: maleylpyruvate isomerase family mycothiol-dependent enzyme [Actinomycetota bacterium]|jgi:uncharacterized protein (TIGR03083 family)|nr:maleylpyruvate isomerase family mycothiol-dependent enzyme [Actinomycetota bacterium]
MSGGGYDEAIVLGSDAIASALELDPGRALPSCPGWDVAELAAHLGSLYERVGAQVRSRSIGALRVFDPPSSPVGPARVGWLREASRGLIEAFAGTEEDAVAGRWRDRTVTAGFWRRRMAHETVVHRVDVEDALGRAVGLEGDLAADGVGEVLELFVPFSMRKDQWPPAGPLGLVRSDGSEEWWVAPGDDRVDVHRRQPGDLQPGDFARVEAPGAELFLICWGRRRPAGPAVTGSAVLLDQWVSLFGW